MALILNGIRAIPSQIFRVPIDEGFITIQLDHKPAIAMWFINVSFGENFTANGIRVQHNYNLLQQYTKLIPFGIFISIPSGVEPTLIDDFSSERVIMNIINLDEKDTIENSYQVR